MNNLSSYKTHELVDELRDREGVETKVVEPYEETEAFDTTVVGPAIILVVTD